MDRLNRRNAQPSVWPKARITVAWGGALSVIHKWFLVWAEGEPDGGEIGHCSDADPDCLGNGR